MAAFSGAEIHENGFSSQSPRTVKGAAIKRASVMPDIDGYAFGNTVDPAQPPFRIAIGLETAGGFTEKGTGQGS